MPTYTWDFSFLAQYWHVLADGLLVSARLFLLTVVLANLLGLSMALGRLSRYSPVRLGTAFLVETVRAIPPLVLVIWMFYCLPILTGLAMSAETTCVVGLALYMSVFFAEIFRGGLLSVDRGLIEAAHSIGMTRLQTIRYVGGPIAFLRMLPPFTSQCILAFKVTTLASFVGISELLYEAKRLSFYTFKPIEVLSCVALIYIAIILPATYSTHFFETRFRTKYFR